MTIQLTPEQERIVDLAIEAGLIQQAEDIMQIGIKTVQQQLEIQPNQQAMLVGDKWQRAFEPG